MLLVLIYLGKEHDTPWFEQNQNSPQVPPPTSCVALGNKLGLREPQLPHLEYDQINFAFYYVIISIYFFFKACKSHHTMFAMWWGFS